MRCRACAAPRASASLFALGGDVPRRDRQARFHPREPRREARSAETGEAERALPVVRASASGVRNELVQLTVVPPPTQRPCRMLIALSRVLRAADSW